MEQKKRNIEWHPAFTASLQIEFESEIDKMTFESEHLLSKKPMQIDELVIKVHDNEKIQKNIGRIFRRLCEIPPEELTITFVCNHYPRKMIQHLLEFQKLQIIRKEPGIYYIMGDVFPIQLLVTKELMEVITRANWQAIKEVKPSMCEALKELMAEEFQELEEQVTERVTERVTEQVTEQVTDRLVRNLYENVGDIKQVAKMLKLPIELVEKVVSFNKYSKDSPTSIGSERNYKQED